MNVTIQNDRRAETPATTTERQREFLTPRVSIVETKDGYHLEAEMPGVAKEGLEVLLEGSQLTLIGRRTPPPQGARLVYRESSQRDYRRVFELDPTIDTARIDAKIENGILKLHLPKAEEVRPRKIQIS